MVIITLLNTVGARGGVSTILVLGEDDRHKTVDDITGQLADDDREVIFLVIIRA